MEPLQPTDPVQVGRYRLEARLGAGGMGQVYLATSPGGRKLAVKVMRIDHAVNPRFRRRFAREIAAARRVGGFHTAQVVDADADADWPWLASAYIEGPSLRERVTGMGPLRDTEMWALGAGLAEGLTAIHACGLVHRDLKPSNVIMARDGPRIIDFGIAQVTDASSLTSDGMVMGTFAFMSPEHVNGEPVEAASDVFSLGSVLAFAARGQGPFDADTISAIVHRIVSVEPDLSALSEDLRIVVSCCLAKRPADRPTAAHLLARFAGPGPRATARRAPASVPPAERGITPDAPSVSSDDPSIVASAAPTTLPGEAWAFLPHTIVPPAAPPPPPLPAPNPPGMRTRRRTLIVGTLAAVAAGGAGTAVALWPSSSPTPDAAPPTTVADRTLTATDNSANVTKSLAFSPDGSTLLVGSTTDMGGGDGVAQLWNVSSGASMGTVPGRGGVDAVAFSRDGRTFVLASDLGYLQVGSASTSQVTRTTTFTSGSLILALSPDGATMAGAGVYGRLDGDLTVGLWDVPTGSNRTASAKPIGYSNDCESVAFSPDGRTVATGQNDATIQLWDVIGATGVGGYRVATAPWSLAFSPSNALLIEGGATGNSNQPSGVVTLRHASTGGVIASHTLDPGTGVTAVCFSPDGALMASGSQDGSVRLWNGATGQLVATHPPTTGTAATTPMNLPQGLAAITSVCFSPDGTMVAIGGSAAGRATVWLRRAV